MDLAQCKICMEAFLTHESELNCTLANKEQLVRKLPIDAKGCDNVDLPSKTLTIICAVHVTILIPLVLLRSLFLIYHILL